MRWFMVPVSICAHVLLVAVLVIVPLAAEDEWPRPAPLQSFLVTMKTAPVPASMVPPATRRPAPAVGVTAPSDIAPEPDTPPEPTGPAMPDVPAVGLGGPAGAGVSDGFGTPIALPLPPPPQVEPPPAAFVRVGGAVREPKKISDVRPVYPSIAIAAKVEGMVILEAVINQRGAVERVKVLRSEPLLDAAAVEAVRKWRYTPTLLNGTPVSVLMTITLHFTLHD
jgi:periplasmic protein TonB